MRISGKKRSIELLKNTEKFKDKIKDSVVKINNEKRITLSNSEGVVQRVRRSLKLV